MSDDCRFCPQCGEATALAESSVSLTTSAEAEDLAVSDYPTAAGLSAGSALAVLSDISSPEAVHAQLTQANLCRLRGEWAIAIDYCVAVLRAEPGNPAAHSLLGDIYRDQGKLDDAIRWYRMAVDLQPNPTDQAKLNQAELAHVRQLSGGDPRLLGGSTTPVALSADGSVVAGTVNLMGVSPRRWLNGLTVTALSFLAIVVLILIGIRSNTRRTSAPLPPRPEASVNTPLSSSDTILPPARPGGGGNPPASATPTDSESGGFPADRPQASTTAPTPTPGAAKPIEHSAANLPPAPILSVRPMPTPSPDNGASGQGRPSTAPSSGDLTALPGNMWIAQVQPDAANGEASVQIVVPVASPSAVTQNQKYQIVRNVVRAARAVFGSSSTVARIHVQVQANATHLSAADATVLQAEIDRPTAMSLNPDTAPIDTLTGQLTSLRWTGAPPGDPVDAGSSDSGDE